MERKLYISVAGLVALAGIVLALHLLRIRAGASTPEPHSLTISIWGSRRRSTASLVGSSANNSKMQDRERNHKEGG